MAAGPWLTRSHPPSSPLPAPQDCQVASVEEYIGDSGRELEGAAEEIVESYMGEYMQVWGFKYP